MIPNLFLRISSVVLFSLVALQISAQSLSEIQVAHKTWNLKGKELHKRAINFLGYREHSFADPQHRKANLHNYQASEWQIAIFIDPINKLINKGASKGNTQVNFYFGVSSLQLQYQHQHDEKNVIFNRNDKDSNSVRLQSLYEENHVFLNFGTQILYPLKENGLSVFGKLDVGLNLMYAYKQTHTHTTLYNTQPGSYNPVYQILGSYHHIHGPLNYDPFIKLSVTTGIKYQRSVANIGDLGMLIGPGFTFVNVLDFRNRYAYNLEIGIIFAPNFSGQID